MALNINGRMKVKTLRADFKKEFGLTLRVYDGRSFADDDSTLAAIRKGDSKGGEFGPRKNTKVGNLEDKIMDMFGIKTQVAGSDDSYLCNNDLTLAGALEADQKKVAKKSKKTKEEVSADESVENDLGGNGTLNESDILEWTSDYDYEFDVYNDGPRLYNQDPGEFFWALRAACEYIITKYQSVHEDHERDWVGDAIMELPIFENKYPEIISLSQGDEPSNYPNTLEELQEDYGFCFDDLIQGLSILTEGQMRLFNLNYLKLMRGGDVVEDETDLKLDKNGWASEITATLQFLMDG